MVTGRSMQLTKQVGEYLVSAELCRREYIATTFTGNVPEFDILAINKKHITIPVQVKAIQSGSWQFDARKFMDIEIKNRKQKVTGKIIFSYPDLIYVLVKIVEQGRDEFYIMRFRDLQSILFRRYKKNLLAKKGVRSKNPESTHTAIWPHELERYRDNWSLIEESFKGKKKSK